jgi:hypothetical protein
MALLMAAVAALAAAAVVGCWRSTETMVVAPVSGEVDDANNTLMAVGSGGGGMMTVTVERPPIGQSSS